jgi:lysophospholipase L1-like esterase
LNKIILLNLIGEGPVGIHDNFVGKETMLDDYREMNKKIASSNNIEYMDVRQAFLNEIPEGNQPNEGIVTVDGEHPNEYGTDVMVKIFTPVLKAWLDSRGVR